MEEKKELLDQDERGVEIELERLRGFVNHPFKVFFVKHFSLKRASEFPVFVKGISLLSAGHSYASRRMRACSIR